jgi:DNA-binding MarR family transcriptional regulator
MEARLSTKFPTTRGAAPPLTLLLQAFDRHLTEALLAHLRPDFPGLTSAHLALFGALDCGATHAAAAAARMGISRQAVARTARELENLGYLRLEQDPERGNRQLLTMTEAGERLARQGWAALGSAEADLAQRVGTAGLAAFRAVLEAEWSAHGPQ